MEKVSKLLTNSYLAQLETLSLKLEKKINAGFTGARKSNTRGNSLEFADFRAYVSGDDIRRIDWNSFGRFDKLFIKLFNEEKQAVINIFLDKSVSMDYGEVNKFAYAKLVAATISYLCLKNADKVNVYCCDETMSISKTNMATKNLFASLVKFLDEIVPSGQTFMEKSIAEVSNTKLGHGASFIISDFFSKDGYVQAVKMLQNKHQQVCLIHVADETELNPTEQGALRLTDAENKDFTDIFVTSAVIEDYKHAFASFQNDIKNFCQKRGVSYIFAKTTDNVIKKIAEV